MAEMAFSFLLQDQHRPFLSSRCYIVADPKVHDRKQWALHFERPQDAAWVYELDDMKDWMLHGSRAVRQIIYDRKDPRTPYRMLERDEVFRAYLRRVLEKLPAEHQSRRKFALMPSIASDGTRTRYKDALEAAIPGVTVMPEPEMVAEYFRLLKRTLQLRPGRNNVILVIDVGASTANMTLIISRRDSKIIGMDTTGAQRDLRLRALRGDSFGHAGRWIDTRLAETLDVEPSGEALREIEKAKVRSSLGEDPVSFFIPGSEHELRIDRATLSALSVELWSELRPLFEKLCERLYDNQTSSEDARRRSEARLKELGISDPGQAHRLIDTILLAGGTSLLPDFDHAMLATLFPDGDQPQVLRVGSSFAIAAAAGGLAHILHNYEPTRLREANTPERDVFAATLESTLPYPLLLGVKQAGDREQQIMLLDPNDPFVDDGGSRTVEGVPVLVKGSQPRARLVPGLAAGVQARQGRQFRTIRVRQSPVKMELHWDALRERASVRSNEIEEGGHLWIEANRLRRRQEPAMQVCDEQLEADALAVDAAEEVVLDLGMSKIVAVAAERGWISSDELDRIISEGSVGGYELREHLPGSSAIRQSESNGIESDWSLGTPASETPYAHGATDPPFEIGSATGISASTSPGKLSEPDGRSSDKGSPADVLDRAAASFEDWGSRVADADFSHALNALGEWVKSSAPHLHFGDVVIALLALSVRPIVLIAGPPGCGKSTLVRVLAQMLGKRRGVDFHEVAVQAHWTDDGALFGRDGLLASTIQLKEAAHLVLFDEFNLTRPEYYLSRLFHAFDSGSGIIGAELSMAPCRIFGTLNIDEASRPPSPKILDRCFLMELTQEPWHAWVEPQSMKNATVPVLPGLPAVSTSGAISDERIDAVLESLHLTVSDHELRHDLLPSRRVLFDIKALLGLHHRLDLQGKGLLHRNDLVDRLIASRILVKLSGAFDQLQPALEVLERVVEGVEELPRTRRRLKLARQQARLGFISPWQ